MSKSKGPWVFLIVLAIGALLIAPTILQGIGDFINTVGSWIQNGFKGSPFDNNQGNNQTLNGQSKVTFEVFYVDGTSRKFDSTPLSIFPLTVYDETGKAIDHINIGVTATMTYTGGTISSWSSSGTLQVDFYKDGVKKVAGPSGPLTASGSAWTSGESVFLGILSISALQMEPYIAPYGDGSYTIKTVGSFTMSVTISGEKVSASGTTPEASCTVKYTKTPTASITGLSFVVAIAPIKD